MPSSKDIIRHKKTGHRYQVMRDGEGRMSEYWILRVLAPDGSRSPNRAMLAHKAWSTEWEVVS